MLGRGVISWLVILFVCVCVFFIAQWLIPLLFNAVGFVIPRNIVNIFALLIAFGVAWGGRDRLVL